MKNDCLRLIISERTQTKPLPLGVRFEWENQLANIFSSLHKVLTTSISSSQKKINAALENITDLM